MNNLQTRRKKLRTSNGCKESFCQSKNQKYFQIWFFPRFSIMSEKCIIYRPLKHHKRLKNSSKLELNFLLMHECFKRVSANCLVCVISCSHAPNLPLCINLVITKYELKSQYVKLTQLWPFVNCLRASSQLYLAHM